MFIAVFYLSWIKGMPEEEVVSQTVWGRFC